MAPKIIFIVPYRNRISHKFFFSQYMTFLLEESDYEIYFSHQFDERPFNRGAVKNIGFLAVKTKYPNDYKDITLVFNDIDTIPFDKIFNYETEVGTVKHFYGFEYALGGILSIKGSDFEKMNGFPNFWGWGMEDAILQKRCEKNDIIIDRSHFFPIGSQEILHLFDGVSRIINKKETIHGKNISPLDGIKTIYKIKYTIDSNAESASVLDNIHIFPNEKIYVINIHYFLCNTAFENEKFHEYDLREPHKKLLQTTRVKPNNNFYTNQWTNIPFYPTAEQKREMIRKFGKDKTEHIIQQSLQNNQHNQNNQKKYKPPATCSVNIGLGGVK